MDLSLWPDSFPDLDLPRPDLRLEERENGIHVWDNIRKNWLVLSPEEWVRQHVIHWLTTHLSFPISLLGVEKQLTRGKRVDVLGYDRNGKPLLLVECKSAKIPINQQTAQQAMMYFAHAKAPFLWLTNGKKHFTFFLKSGTSIWTPISQLPDFHDMIGEMK